MLNKLPRSMYSVRFCSAAKNVFFQWVGGGGGGGGGWAGIQVGPTFLFSPTFS